MESDYIFAYLMAYIIFVGGFAAFIVFLTLSSLRSRGPKRSAWRPPLNAGVRKEAFKGIYLNDIFKKYLVPMLLLVFQAMILLLFASCLFNQFYSIYSVNIVELLFFGFILSPFLVTFIISLSSFINKNIEYQIVFFVLMILACGVGYYMYFVEPPDPFAGFYTFPIYFFIVICFVIYSVIFKRSNKSKPSN